METKTATALEDERYGLLFGVRKSIRYHSRRRRFFERIELMSHFSSLVFGSAAVAVVLSTYPKEYAAYAGAFVSVMAAMNLVIGVSRMARLHEELARRFVELEKAMSLAGDVSEQQLAEFYGKRLDIEADEPPAMRILDAMCHNEVARAEGWGPEEFVPLRWYQRWLAHVLSPGEHRIKKYGTVEA